MKYSIRAWKLIDHNNKRLIDIEETNKKHYADLIYKSFKELYNYYNYEIEYIKNKV
jgi:hypothetical protein